MMILVLFTVALLVADDPVELTKLQILIGGRIEQFKGSKAWPVNKVTKKPEKYFILPKGNYEVTLDLPQTRKAVIHAKQLDLVQSDEQVTAIVMLDSTPRAGNDVLAEAKRITGLMGIDQQDEVSRRVSLLKSKIQPIVIRGLIAHRTLVGISIKQHVIPNKDGVSQWYFVTSVNWVSEDDWKDLFEIDKKTWKNLSELK